MFKTEQKISQKLKNASKNGISSSGTTLAKQRMMKNHFTYKEITTVVGVIVALLIAVTLWASRPPLEANEKSVTPPAAPVLKSSLISVPVQILELYKKASVR